MNGRISTSVFFRFCLEIHCDAQKKPLNDFQRCFENRPIKFLAILDSVFKTSLGCWYLNCDRHQCLASFTSSEVSFLGRASKAEQVNPLLFFLSCARPVHPIREHDRAASTLKKRRCSEKALPLPLQKNQSDKMMAKGMAPHFPSFLVCEIDAFHSLRIALYSVANLESSQQPNVHSATGCTKHTRKLQCRSQRKEKSNFRSRSVLKYNL